MNDLFDKVSHMLTQFYFLILWNLSVQLSANFPK